MGGSAIELTAATSIVGAPGTLIAATNGNAVLHSPIVDIDRISATSDILVNNFLTAGTIDIAFAQAGRDVTLDGGDVNITFAEAGDDFTANTFSFTGGTVETTGAGPDSEDGVGPLVGSNIVIDTIADLRLEPRTPPGTSGSLQRRAASSAPTCGPTAT